MFLAQLALSMLVWAATVAGLAKRRERLLSFGRSLSRARRAALAVGSLLGSVALLGLGMAALALGGLRPTGLTFWGWPLITLVGAAFIALQTVGLVPLVLNAVTPGPVESSDSLDSDRP